MSIDILYLAGCPHFPPTLELVHQVVRELGVDAVIREVEVNSAEQATRLRFLGSPTIHVDGVDAEPAARQRTDFSFGCRLYEPAGVISRELVRSALVGSRA